VVLFCKVEVFGIGLGLSGEFAKLAAFLEYSGLGLPQGSHWGTPTGHDEQVGWILEVHCIVLIVCVLCWADGLWAGFGVVRTALGDMSTGTGETGGFEKEQFVFTLLKD